MCLCNERALAVFIHVGQSPRLGNTREVDDAATVEAIPIVVNDRKKHVSSKEARISNINTIFQPSRIYINQLRSTDKIPLCAELVFDMKRDS